MIAKPQKCLEVPILKDYVFVVSNTAFLYPFLFSAITYRDILFYHSLDVSKMCLSEKETWKRGKSEPAKKRNVVQWCSKYLL